MAARLWLGLLLLLSPLLQASATIDNLAWGRFGKVSLYRPEGAPKRLVLVVSDHRGWQDGDEVLARRLADLGMLVAGIDYPRYRQNLETATTLSCAPPNADFDALAQHIEKALGLPRYLSPILVGQGESAGLVYAALAQSPPMAFSGAISLGFSPELQLKRPLCKHNGLDWQPGSQADRQRLLPQPRLPAPWLMTPAPAHDVAKAFVDGDKRFQLDSPPAWADTETSRRWLRQALSRFPQPASQTTGGADKAALADLPLVELPAGNDDPSLPMAVVLSGDGGWASIDRGIAEYLSSRGMPVVGLNALKYFWKARSPEETARALTAILSHYRNRWHRDRVLLIGFSFGAEVLPFAYNRLPDEPKASVIGLVLLAPTTVASFEFELTDWLGGNSGEYPTLPETTSIRNLPLLCFYAEDGEGELCPRLKQANAQVVRLDGGHHFGGDYEGLSARILTALKLRLPPPQSGAAEP